MLQNVAHGLKIKNSAAFVFKYYVLCVTHFLHFGYFCKTNGSNDIPT